MAIKLIGKLTKMDFEIIVPLMVTEIEEYHKIALYVEMQDFHGWTAEALWADTKFDLRHHKDFSRIAFVGDQTWEEWMAILSKPFTSAAVRYFDELEREAALRWSSGGRF